MFLLVFAVSFALLKKTKIFGESDGANALISFIVGLLTIMFTESQVLIINFIPWTVLFMVLILFIFMFFMFLGVKEEDMVNVAKDTSFTTFTVIAIIILFLVAMSKAFGPFLLADGGGGFWAVTKRAIFSTRFLGVIFLLFVAAYAVRFISPAKEKD